MSLRGTREIKDNYQLFRLTGLLDAFSEPTFRKVMEKCVEEGPKNLILDLSKIDFVDSSGLGALVQLVKKAQSVEGGTVPNCDQCPRDPNCQTSPVRTVFVTATIDRGCCYSGSHQLKCLNFAARVDLAAISLSSIDYY